MLVIGLGKYLSNKKYQKGLGNFDNTVLKVHVFKNRILKSKVLKGQWRYVVYM